jgi:DNA-binding MarR family transcriptional regulator
MDVENLASELRVTIGLLVRQIRARKLEESGDLTLPETSALARLDRLGPMTAAEMARREQISPQSMGATLAGLESRGLITRAVDPHDGRRMILTPSDAGLEVLRSRRTARTEQLARALRAEFSKDELSHLAVAAPLLERLAQAL